MPVFKAKFWMIRWIIIRRIHQKFKHLFCRPKRYIKKEILSSPPNALDRFLLLLALRWKDDISYSMAFPFANVKLLKQKCLSMLAHGVAIFLQYAPIMTYRRTCCHTCWQVNALIFHTSFRVFDKAFRIYNMDLFYPIRRPVSPHC